MEKQSTQNNALLGKVAKQYSNDVKFLFVVILTYLLCVVPIVGGWPQYMRYIILPLFIIVAYKRVGTKMRLDYVTIMLFIFAVIPSVLFSPYRINALVKSITVLMMFIGCSLYFNSRKNFGLSALYRALVFIGYVTVFINMIRFVSGGTGYDSGFFRGFFGNRNSAGPTFVITFIVFLAEIWRKKGYKKLVPIVFAVCDVLMIIETQSRGAFMGLIIGVVVFLFFAIKRKDKFWMMVGIILIFVILFWQKISEWDIVKRVLEEGLSRGDLWSEAKRTIKNNFAIGVGFGCSEKTNQLVGNEGYNYHNSYISLMADIGLFGVLCIIVMFIILFYRIAKNYKKVKKEEKLFYITFLAIALAFLGLSFGESYLIAAGSPFSFIFWCVIFCMAEYVPKKSKHKLKKHKELSNSVKERRAF